MRCVLLMMGAWFGCGRSNFDVCTAPTANIQRVQVRSPGAATGRTSTTIDQTAGNLLVVALYHDDYNVAPGFADTASSDWQTLARVSGNPACSTSPGALQIRFARATTTGQNTFMTDGNGYIAGLFVAEYSGVSATTPLHIAASQISTDAESQTFTAGTLDTTQGTVVLAVFESRNTGPATLEPADNWVAIGRDDAFSAMLAEASLPAGTIVPEAWSPRADNCWAGASAAFAAAEQ